MALGPIELLVLKFPGNQFSGEIIPALCASSTSSLPSRTRTAT
jgi:hypothetical protein